MSLLERSIHLDYRLRVHFTQDVFSPSNLILRNVLEESQTAPPHKALLILDESLAHAQPNLAGQIDAYFQLHGDSIKLMRAPVVMEGGERAKNSDRHVSQIHSDIHRLHIDRHSYVIGVGGGALLDVVGFAAATAHRGIRLVRIPTTTLSQADSGVGVKNGINAFGKKNFIGTFAPPFAVINDFQFIESLSERDKRAGCVEAVKVALIRDKSFFGTLEHDAPALARFEPAAMQRLIRRCAELHMDHIATSGDPFEFGAARPLDFGHWSAHKLEQLSDYRIRHGEAVAVGIALDVVYSRRAGYLDAGASVRILNLLEALGFDLFAEELLQKNDADSLQVLEGLEEFREHLGGRLAITLLRQIGCGFEVHAMDPAKVSESIHELKERRDSARRETVSGKVSASV